MDAEALDPLHVDLLVLRSEVGTGLREERYRRVIEVVKRQVHGITTTEDAVRVAAVVSRALDTIPL